MTGLNRYDTWLRRLVAEAERRWSWAGPWMAQPLEAERLMSTCLLTAGIARDVKPAKSCSPLQLRPAPLHPRTVTDDASDGDESQQRPFRPDRRARGDPVPRGAAVAQSRR